MGNDSLHDDAQTEGAYQEYMAMQQVGTRDREAETSVDVVGAAFPPAALAGVGEGAASAAPEAFGSSIQSQSNTVEPLDLRALAANKPAPIDYVLPALPVGTVGILAGAGGAGKSMWALQAMYSVAAGQYCDFGLGTLARANGTLGRVMYFSLEDPENILHHRIYSISQAYSSDQNRAQWVYDLANLIQLYPLSGHGFRFIDALGQVTPEAAQIDEVIARNVQQGRAEGRPLRLIIIDTLRRAHDRNENDNGDMAQVLRYFESLAARYQAAVLLLHHESKAGLKDADAGASALRGASAISDNARWAARLRTMNKVEGETYGLNTEAEEHRFYLRIGLKKTNYGPPAAGAWLKRGEGGVLQDWSDPLMLEAQGQGNGYRGPQND